MKSTFIHIRSDKFPVLPGEDDELVNEGMYGKALGLYLQNELDKRGYTVPFVCCEDWGWWVELRSAPFPLGVCIYSGPGEDGPSEFVCTDGATARSYVWSWKKFRRIETTPWIEKLYEDLLSVFREDEDIEIVGMSDEFPL